MTKVVALISGGYSEEKIIAEKSAQNLFDAIKQNFEVYHVVIDENNWSVKENEREFVLDKNDFSFMKDNQKIKFDYAYITIHGTPGEDGLLQGYLDMLNIPYSTPSQTASTLTFDKWLCNRVLSTQGINVAKGILLYQNQYNQKEIIDEVGIPCFVKPNNGGSSFGASLVRSEEELPNAIDKAFNSGKSVIIESFLEGREFTCGICEMNGGITPLLVTEIVSHNDFFDFEAKYEGASEEITPAQISDKETNLIKDITSKIYQILRLNGICRMDYILTANGLYLIEVNTTPGMSNESLIPQQLEYLGMPLSDVVKNIIEYNKVIK